MAGIADELKRIPMSEALAATLTRAVDYAGAQSLGEVALEHLLLALTEDEDAGQVLSASHIDGALLKADVSQYLGGLELQEPVARSGPITLAVDLIRILKAAAAAASQGRRREINGAIVLAAIVGDGRSSAAHMLRAQGLTFEEAIKALQRALASPGSAKPPTPVAAPKAVSQPEAEQVIATARARVQTRAAPGMPPPLGKPERPQDTTQPTLNRSEVLTGVRAADPAQPMAAVGPSRTEAGPAAWPPPVRSSRDAIAGMEAGGSTLSGDQSWHGQDRETPSADGAEGGYPASSADEYEGSSAYNREPIASRNAADHGIGASTRQEVSTRPGASTRLEPYQTPTAPQPSVYEAPPTPPILSPQPFAQEDPEAQALLPAGVAVAPRAGLLVRRPSAPSVGTRWPAPVAPAWLDTEPTPVAQSLAAPPPLPSDPTRYLDPLALVPPPLPPALPPIREAGARLDTGDPSPWPAPYGPYTMEAVREGPTASLNDLANGYAHDGNGAWSNPEIYATAEPNYAAGASSVEENFGAATAWQPDSQLEDWQGEAFQHGPADSASADPARPVVLRTEPRPVKRRKSSERAASGQMSETIPRRMRAGLPSLVEIRLETHDFRSLADGLQGEDSTTRPLSLAAAMSVSLSAPDGGFAIVLASPQTQWLAVVANPSVQDFASWHWHVTPLKPGRRNLYMAISIRTLAADGTPTVTTLPDQTVEIRVRRNVARGARTVLSWLLAALSGWLFATYAYPLVNPLIAEVLKVLK